MKTLFVAGGNAGGTGKTTALVLISDWLKAKGRKRSHIDADPGNRGSARSFEHWLNGEPLRRLNIQDPDDLDAIFRLAAQAPDDGAVLADLPANAGGNIGGWFREIATEEVWTQSRVRLVTVIAVTSNPGAVQNALDWLSVVGPQGKYLIVLNRLRYTLVPKPVEEEFKEWFEVETDGYDVKTVEITHLNPGAIRQLISAKTLPSQFSGDVLSEKHVKTWAGKVHEQLDSALNGDTKPAK